MKCSKNLKTPETLIFQHFKGLEFKRLGKTDVDSAWVKRKATHQYSARLVCGNLPLERETGFEPATFSLGS